MFLALEEKYNLLYIQPTNYIFKLIIILTLHVSASDFNIILEYLFATILLKLCIFK